MSDDDVDYDNSDRIISWNVHMLDLPPELLIDIFLFLVNWKSVVSLRLSCRQLDAIYQRVAPLVLRSQRERLTEPFKKFYEFLVRLRLPPSQLRIPPAEGWWNTKPAGYPDDDDDTRFNKTPFALDVMRHLPCIAPFQYIWDNETNIAHRSTVCNYSEPATVNSMTIPWLEYLHKQTLFDDAPPSPSTHTICITIGWDRSGIALILDTLTGLFYELGDQGDPPFRLPAQEYLETRMTMLENCEEVFLPGGDVLVLRRKQHGNWLPWEDNYDSEKMEKEGEPVDAGRWVDSEADAQWVRHLHFKHGWPGKDWDKTACLRAIQEYVGRRQAEQNRR